MLRKLLILFLFPLILSAETIYSEDFQSCAVNDNPCNGIAFPGGATFYSVKNQSGSRVAKVRNTGGVFLNVIMTIDISMHTAIGASLDFGDNGVSSNADRFKAQYRIDGAGGWTNFISQNGTIGSSSGSVAALEGASLEIRVRVRCNGGGERWWWDNVLVTGTPIPLPVELLYFTAEVDGTKVTFNWATGAEINNDFFTIQESIDGVTYTDIEFIAGAGNSSTKIEYSISKQVTNEDTYYRLRQVDFDGTTSYSNLVGIPEVIDTKPKYIVAMFNINGVNVSIDAKGLIFIKYNDGTIRKVFH